MMACPHMGFVVQCPRQDNLDGPACNQWIGAAVSKKRRKLWKTWNRQRKNMADAQQQLVEHYKAVRARLEAAPKSALAAPVAKKKSDFEGRTDEVKAWVQRELTRWNTVPRAAGTIPINVLIEQVAKKYEVPVPLMLQDARVQKLVRARQELYYRCVMEKGWSYSRIGRYFDRDHTTVLHGVRAHARKHDLPLPEGIKR